MISTGDKKQAHSRLGLSRPRWHGPPGNSPAQQPEALPRSRLLVVAPTDREDRIRIINARELTRAEREAYEGEIARRKG